MRIDAFLLLCERLPLDDLTRRVSRGLVVVAPHPDDETLGCGGLIAEARARGLAVEVIVLSDGAGSHPNSRAYPKSRLVALRQAESRLAAEILGLDRVSFLGLPDGAVPTSGPAVAAIAEAARAIQADAIFVTWAHDPHCDHKAAAALVAAAQAEVPEARLYAYPIWGRTLPRDHEVGPAPTGFRLDMEAHRAAKAEAIAAHRSQITDLIDDDPDGFRLTPAMLDHFAGRYEIFIDVTPETSR